MTDFINNDEESNAQKPVTRLEFYVELSKLRSRIFKEFFTVGMIILAVIIFLGR